MKETKDLLVSNMETILNIKWELAKNTLSDDSLERFRLENKQLIGEHSIEGQTVGNGWGVRSKIRIKK